MSYLCDSWTCPRCNKTWISATRNVKRCGRCGLLRSQVYQVHWRELTKRRLDDAT